MSPIKRDKTFQPQRLSDIQNTHILNVNYDYTIVGSILITNVCPGTSEPERSEEVKNCPSQEVMPCASRYDSKLRYLVLICRCAGKRNKCRWENDCKSNPDRLYWDCIPDDELLVSRFWRDMIRPTVLLTRNDPLHG